MQNLVLTAISTKRHAALAYSDYLADINSTYSTLVSLIADLLEPDVPEELGDDPVWDSGNIDDVTEAALNAVSAWAYDRIESTIGFGKKIPVPGGYVYTDDLIWISVSSVIDAYTGDNEMASYGSSSQRYDYLCLGLYSSDSIHYRDEDMWVDETISVDAFVDCVKSTYHGSIVSRAALIAAVANSVSDRLLTYTNTIKQTFTDAFDDISNTVVYYQSILQDPTLDGDTVLESVLNSLVAPLEAVADGQAASSVNGDVYQYTGASPAGAVDFSTAANAVATTAKICCKAAKGALKLIAKIGKKVFKKVANVVTEIMVDPYDVKTIEGGSSPTIDGWAVSRPVQTSNIQMPAGYLSQVERDIVNSWFATRSSSWFKFDTIFFEALIRISDITFYDLDIDLKYEAQLKLKPVDPLVAIDVLKRAGAVAHGNYNPSGYSAAFDNGTKANLALHISAPGNGGPRTFLAYTNSVVAGFTALANNPGIYCSPSTHSEVDMYYGYACSKMLTGYAMLLALKELYIPKSAGDTYDISSVFSAAPGPNPLYMQVGVEKLDSGSVTNFDFINAASGFNTGDESFGFGSVCSAHSPWVYNSQAYFAYSDNAPFWAIAMLLCYNRVDRALHPFDYVFIPFRENVAGFEPSKFAIKTDAENAAVAEKFISVLAVVVVVAVVAGAAALTVSKLRRAKALRLAKRTSRAQLKSALGMPLSRSESRALAAGYSMASKSANFASGIMGISGLKPITEMVGGLVAASVSAATGQSQLAYNAAQLAKESSQTANSSAQASEQASYDAKANTQLLISLIRG